MISEAGTRIGTTLDTVHTAQELADVGADHLADLVTVDLLSSALSEDETHPAAGAPTLRRIAQAVSKGCPAPETVVVSDPTREMYARPGRRTASMEPGERTASPGASRGVSRPFTGWDRRGGERGVVLR